MILRRGKLCPDDATNVINAGVKWRISRDYCLLDQNQTHHLTPAQRSFRGANILISVLLILLVAALFYKDYASLFRNNKELVKSLSPSNSIVASWSWYSHQRSANLPLIRIGEDAHRNPLMQNGKRKT